MSAIHAANLYNLQKSTVKTYNTKLSVNWKAHSVQLLHG